MADEDDIIRLGQELTILEDLKKFLMQNNIRSYVSMSPGLTYFTLTIHNNGFVDKAMFWIKKDRIVVNRLDVYTFEYTEVTSLIDPQYREKFLQFIKTIWITNGSFLKI